MMKTHKKRLNHCWLTQQDLEIIFQQEAKKKFYVAIRGFDISIDLERPENKELIEELYSRYEIEEPKTIVKKVRTTYPFRL